MLRQKKIDTYLWFTITIFIVIYSQIIPNVDTFGIVQVVVWYLSIEMDKYELRFTIAIFSLIYLMINWNFLIPLQSRIYGIVCQDRKRQIRINDLRQIRIYDLRQPFLLQFTCSFVEVLILLYSTIYGRVCYDKKRQNTKLRDLFYLWCMIAFILLKSVCLKIENIFELKFMVNLRKFLAQINTNFQEIVEFYECELVWFYSLFVFVGKLFDGVFDGGRRLFDGVFDGGRRFRITQQLLFSYHNMYFTQISLRKATLPKKLLYIISWQVDSLE
eukprot:TRINITY_DN3606_c0_g1_i8.p1 TRINITY_DN3606_c0_g1~~TRINITY_DN3606_c0_g1_i8.p1  ORF type:complete len:273 (+),score=3.23 TRINITY_DN3606_c0_g1_i8:194-1012(+)